jgi:TPR repeat protein
VACWQLGTRRRDGDGVARDARAALDALVRACDLGWGRACVAGADLLTAGGEVPADLTRAASLRTRGCEAEPRLCAPR